MKKDEWLKSLKPKDKVIVQNTLTLSPGVLREVKRVTKTMIVLNDDSRYRKESGYLVSSDAFIKKYLEIPTATSVKKILSYNKKRKIVNELVEFCWIDMDLEHLEKVHKIVKESKNSKEKS